MASIYSWESFIRIHGGEPGARDVFEKVMDELLREENPSKEVHIVKAVQGDDGIDVYVYQEDGIDIYQCKFFMGRMTDSRWGQVRKSFSRAMESKRVKVLRWVLCMPREMQKEDIKKWDKFRKDRGSYDVEILLVDGNEIIQRMQDCDRNKGTDLVGRYFGSTGGTARVLPKCLTNYIPVGPEIGLVGRDKIVDELRAMLDEEKCIALVRGLGGIGKTAVMQKVCDIILSDGNDKNHVAWITCGDSLEDDLLALGDAFGVPKEIGRDEAFGAVLREMKGIEGRLYLFLDDLSRDSVNKDLERLNALRPNVHVMITSRQEIKGIPHKVLNELKEDSAVDMFYEYYERDEERKYLSDVRGIIDADSVKRHTLLVELLAKAANRSFDTLEVFRGKLEEKKFFEVSRAKLSSVHDGHDENMTIEESVIKLYGISELSDEQKRIMSLFSIFTPEKEIYGKVVEWAGFDENDVDKLVRRGWLVRGKIGYVIHQIVRDSIARQVGDELRIEEFGDVIGKVAKTSDYMQVELGYTTVRERLILVEDVAKHLDGRMNKILIVNGHSEREKKVLRIGSDLLNNLADVYYSQGDYKKAVEYYEKALEIRERILGSIHPDTATTYNNMAVVFRAQGEYVKALEYHEKALKIVERILGGDHPYTAATYDNIAGVYKDQGDYEKALEYYKKAIKIRESVLGSNHPDTATTYNNIGGVYNAQGDYEKALDYYEKSVAINEQTQRKDRLSTAKTYNNIGGVYKKQKDYEKALEYYRKSVEIIEQVLGRDHPSTATLYNNMGGVYKKQRDYEKALEYYRKSAEINEQVLGRDHPTTAKTYNNIALLYCAQGDNKKALGYYEKALKVLRVKLGENHPFTKETQLSIKITTTFITAF